MPPSGQIPLRFPESRLTFKTMAITDANRTVCAAVRKAERWPYHAFCLIGPEGSGVTTLARAWAKERNGVYLDASDAAQLDLSQLEKLAEQDVAIDNVETFSDAETLLLILSGIERQQNVILLTAHTGPSQWVFQSPDLISRLKAAPLAELPAPDEDMMRVRLRRAFARSCLSVPESVEDFLVTRLGLDYSLIEQTAELLAGASGDRPLTIPLVREILRDAVHITE
jgi:chromosomal replication initiation ATPase DnaA